MKLKYASAFTSNSEIDNSLMLPIDPERQVESRKFIEIVEGRLEEIIENVWFQVPSEYTDKLLGGIILTGGGANMKNIDIAFRNHTHIDKIRIANFVSQTINSTNSDINAHNAEFNTVLGLLAKGDMNCAGEEIHNDLFGTNDTTKPLSNDQHKVRQPNDIAGTGVVRTEAEKKAEEERIRKEQEEEEERIRKEQEEEEERLRKERKENSTGHKFMRGLKKFFTTIVSAEEDV
jgi:cell division protein FtsA